MTLKKKINSFLGFAFILGWWINTTLSVPPVLPLHNWHWWTPCFSFSLFPLTGHHPVEIDTGVSIAPTCICTLPISVRGGSGGTHTGAVVEMVSPCAVITQGWITSYCYGRLWLLRRLKQDVRSWANSALAEVVLERNRSSASQLSVYSMKRTVDHHNVNTNPGWAEKRLLFLYVLDGVSHFTQDNSKHLPSCQ